MERSFIIGKRTSAYSDRWINVEVLETFVDGVAGSYTVVHRNNSVSIIPITKDSKFVLLDQYRFPIGSFSTELPMGGVDGDETAQSAAVREASEEINCIVDNIKHIGSFFPVPGVSPQMVDVFLANVSMNQFDPNNLQDEIVHFSEYDLNEVKALIKSGAIKDGLTLSSFSIYLAGS